MIGLGTGARSYTATAHYSTRYAVARRGVIGIIGEYSASEAESFRFARHGIAIGSDERMRRFVLKSILRSDGLDADRFEALFGVAPLEAFPALGRLGDMGLVGQSGGAIRPTAAGLEHSDAIPPLFYSEPVRCRMKSAVPA